MENKDSLNALMRSIERDNEAKKEKMAAQQSENRPAEPAANQELSQDKAKKMAQIRAALNRNEPEEKPQSTPPADSVRPVKTPTVPETEVNRALPSAPQASKPAEQPAKAKPAAFEEMPKKPSAPEKAASAESAPKKRKKKKSAKKSGKNGFNKLKKVFGPPALAEHGISYGMMIGTIGAGLAISLVASYLLVAGTYKDKCLPNTYVNAIKVSGLTEEGAEATLIEKTEVKDLVLITHKGDEVTFKASDFNLHYTVPRGSLDTALSENPYTWVGKVFNDSEYKVDYNLIYDEDKLRTLLNEYDWGDEESHNACIVRQDDGSFTIQAETLGDQFDTEVLLRFLRKNMTNGMSKFKLEDTGAYEGYRALVRSEDLQQELEIYNNYARCVITYDFDDRKKVVSPDMIADWIMTDPDGTVQLDANGKALFDVNAVQVFVAQMAAETDTVGKPRHFFATLDGWIDVPWNGDYSSTYGWKINQTNTVIQLIGLMQEGKTVTVEPEYERRGYCRKKDDIGNTYVEADISAQHFWVYKDGQCVMDDDFVSGTETNKERRTPRGVCSILSKNRNVTLGTYAVQGYECPVSFWMPFNWLGCGFHDLSRGAYGGSIYMYNGSHGCLNLKYSVAKQLFETVETGMPVLVHD